ncbi:MAG: PBP1A family penicillin-binding protein [Treponema sp.]|nr:PBP1A family penicillin-binding protein [Spirochaetia bacterium]MDD7460660.1 PBP1A family penicillin-binding protein [Spirochaetales bacterium]MDY5811104.1 PBP1A family penicillin-binding protein [Treponema sp.]
MKIAKHLPAISLGVLIFFSIVFGALLGKGLAQTVNTINTENFTDFETALPTRLLDVHGELITEFASDERREIIAITDLPQHMKDALLTREDRIFYSHHGFSFKALSRAVVGVLTRRSLGGGSTLTQQIAGTLYADRSDYSIKRKFRELWWAIQMERHLSKDEILELYINRTYFGGGTYGVNAASKYYFGHSATEITPAEAAILVIQLSNPSFYNPFEHPNRAMARQKDVLTSMVQSGYITQKEADESFDDYWASFDYTRTSASAHTMQNNEAPWFSEYVRRTLNDMIYGTEDIYTSGFTVNTSLNLAHQKAADEIMQDYIKAANRLYKRTMNSHERYAFSKYIPLTELVSLTFNLPDLKMSAQRNQTIAIKEYRNKINPMVDIFSMMFGIESLKTEIVNKGNSLTKQNAEKTTIEGTMIALENSTGYIDAMVGGSKYDQENQFIRAVQAKLQPGSTFKPLYYSEAIENHQMIEGHPASMTAIISDTPVVFHKEDGTPYIPQDFKGQWEGDVPLWYALAHSMNVPSVKVLDAVGFDAAIKRTSSLLGIPSNELEQRHFDSVYPLGLGVCSVRPIEMAKAYATIANKGHEVTPIAILSVEDKYGNEILNPEKELRSQQKAQKGGKQILKEESAFIMQEIMKQTVASGSLRYGADWDSTYYVTGKRKSKGSKFRLENSNGQKFDMPVAGKTGTTQNWADAWAAGFTPYYTSVFWFGFDRPGQSLGLSITGSTLAGVAWGDFMNAANKGKGYKPFYEEKPKELIQLEVCSKSGGLLTPGCEGYRMTAYYYPGTEPTEPCKKHTDSTGRTLGTYRLRLARYRSGYDFMEDADLAPLSVDLRFLRSGKLSSELNIELETENDYATNRDPDDFSNWLLD